MDATQLAHSLGIATGRREVAERLLGELRRSAAAWRVAEATAGGLRGSLRSAFFWQLTERWCGRLEGLAAQVEAQLGELRTAEHAARAAYEQALQRLTAPPAAPAPEPRRWWGKR